MTGQVAFFRFAAAFSVLGATVLGAGLTTLFDRSQRWLARAEAFGAGVLLAVALVAILPSAVEHLGSSSWYPAAYVLVGSGFILSMIVEFAVAQLSLHAKHMPVPVNDVDEEEQEQMLPSSSIEMAQLEAQTNDDIIDDDQAPEAAQQHGSEETEYNRPSFQPHFITAVTTFALCFYGFSRGVSIGANEHRSVQPLLADISLAFLIASALTSLVLTQGVALPKSVAAAGVAYPFGIVVGAVLRGWPWNVTSQGSMQSMVCGALLHIACAHSVGKAFKDRTDGVWKLLSLSIGFGWAVASVSGDQEIF